MAINAQDSAADMNGSQAVPIAPKQAVTPSGINHIVLSVRDIEISHQFWSDILGFKQVGEFEAADGSNPERRAMRFYSGDHEGLLQHHDIALVEVANFPDPGSGPSALQHVDIAYPDREAWQTQLAFVQSKNIKFDRRVNHGMTHSLYISDPNGHGVELLYELPRKFWGGNINAALNHVESLPTEGAEALLDDLHNSPTF